MRVVKSDHKSDSAQPGYTSEHRLKVTKSLYNEFINDPNVGK